MRLAQHGAEPLLLLLFLAGAAGLRLNDGGPQPPEEAAVSEDLPDDALRLLSYAPSPFDASPSAPAGAKRVADTWRTCAAWAKDVPHEADVVASLRGNFLFVDNVKAGSTSLRWLFGSLLHADWKATDAPHSADRLGCLGRTSTRSFPPAALASMLRFAVVRDPVAKFESGVREAWRNNASLQHLTADEMLERQLRLDEAVRKPGQVCGGNWLDEHLQPSSWRLAASSYDGQLLDYNFIAKIETFDADWPVIVSAMTNVSVWERGKLMVVGQINHRSHDPRSKLSPEGVRRMCQSSVYGREWECFGYPRPAECG